MRWVDVVLIVLGLCASSRPCASLRVFRGRSRRPGGYSVTTAFGLRFGGLAGLLALGCAAHSPRSPRLAGAPDRPSGPLRAGLARELALAGRAGRTVRRRRPGERRHLRGSSPIRGSRSHGRIKARDNFYSDLSAVLHRLRERPTSTTSFRSIMPHSLYEVSSIRCASRRRLKRDDLMNEAVEDFDRQVRQSVFDRMGVAHIVSDRVRSRPGLACRCERELEWTRVCDSVQPWVLAASPTLFRRPSFPVRNDGPSIRVSLFGSILGLVGPMEFDPLRDTSSQLAAAVHAGRMDPTTTRPPAFLR